METIRFEIDVCHIARIYLNQPEKHNALSPLMMQELIDVFEQIAQDQAIRAVVLSGVGDSFCAGGDLKWMLSNLDKPRDERSAESRILAGLFASIDRCPKLVIGRINGAAYGGGVGLVSVCDIAIGVESANFALTEVKLGLVPANISPYVLRKMGASNMRRTALNAAPFNARTAESFGLLNLAVSESEFDQAVEKELKLALACAPGAVATTKKLISDLSLDQFDDVTESLVAVLGDAWEGEEAQAGIKAFFARQAPSWKSE